MKQKMLKKMEGRVKKVEVLRRIYGLGINEAMRVWDVIGKPAMEYGAEVWANRPWREGEKVMLKLGKRLIGMRRNTNNEVVQGELGLWRMKGRWDLARLKLWKKLVEGKNPLASWVYRQRRDEFEAGGKKDKNNWCWCTWQVMKSIGREVEWDLEYVAEAAWAEGVRADIGQREEDEWRQRVSAKPRLRTYRLIKDKLEFEWYLEHSTGARKTALVEMRSGANDLEIDQGRRRKMEIKDRTCMECKKGIEDEIHVVLECQAYEHIRQKMLAELRVAGVQVQGATREGIWKSVMKGSEKKRGKILGKYVAMILEARRKKREERKEQGDREEKRRQPRFQCLTD